MKSIILFLFLFCRLVLFAQPVRIHSHNDYRQARPLQEALACNVFSIEADIFLYQGQLRVAHDEAELPNAPLLDSLYIQPLLRWFKANPAGDSNYFPFLLIDIKSNSAAVLPALVKLLEPYPTLFNPQRMQVVISGDRGVQKDWSFWPGYFLFDGRPGETYDTATLARVGFISDAYKNYSLHSRKKIKLLANSVHQSGKLLRLWGIPDHPASWKKLKAWGVDIINTDQVRICREYFKE
jgi:alkaline phosphatase